MLNFNLQCAMIQLLKLERTCEKRNDMDCLFDHRVDRSGVLTWLKDAFTPQSVKDAGLLGYAGAEFEFPTCPAIGKGIREVAEKGIIGFTLPNDAYRNQ